MPDGLSEDDRYELGVRLGKVIWQIFEAIAAADGMAVHEAVEEWISAYIAERIIAPGDDL